MIRDPFARGRSEFLAEAAARVAARERWAATPAGIAWRTWNGYRTQGPRGWVKAWRFRRWYRREWGGDVREMSFGAMSARFLAAGGRYGSAGAAARSEARARPVSAGLVD